jgi:hypothetical protein
MSVLKTMHATMLRKAERWWEAADDHELVFTYLGLAVARSSFSLR